MKIRLFFLLFCSLLFGSNMFLDQFCLVCFAAKQKEEWPNEIKLSTKNETAAVLDLDTCAFLYSKGAMKKRYPASITKVMTALVAIENGNLKDTVKFSHEAVYGIEPGSSHIARDEGEKMSLKNCLYALLLASANECASAIAEHVGGDYDSFIGMMNERAKELGCVNTHFTNPHGLHNEDHYTCAYDMAIIARAAFKNKTFRKIVGTKAYTIPPTNKHSEPTILNNQHQMLNFYHTSAFLYDDCVGGKTGYTTEAINTLVTYAKKDGRTLVCVVLAANQHMQYIDTRALFDYCFSNFHNEKIDSASYEEAVESDETGLLAEGSSVVLMEGFYATLPNGVSIDEADASVCAPSDEPFYSKDSDSVDADGFLELSYAENRIGSIPFSIIAPPSAEEEPPKEEDDASEKKNYFHHLAIVFAAIGAVIILVVIYRAYIFAPYYHYYGSERLKEHFLNKRKKRLEHLRKNREE